MSAKHLASLLLSACLLYGCGSSANAQSYLGLYTTATPSGISPSVTVTQTTSGVAPATVFFDASATTAAIYTAAPYRDLSYSWNFDDAGCASGTGNWTYGAAAVNGNNSARNTDQGFEAVHTYECAGTFHPVLTVTYGSHTSTWTGSITVTDADTYYSGTSTICFSNAATFTGCPAGATQVSSSSSLSSAISTYVGTGKRLLFERGGTWTSSSQINITPTGPITFGAYGSGAKPIWNWTGASGGNFIRMWGGATSPSDYRFMDISITGRSYGITNEDSIAQLLFLRMDFSGTTQAFGINASGPQYYTATTGVDHPAVDLFVVQDSTCDQTGAGGANCTLSATSHIAFVGDLLNNGGTQQQVLRISLANPGVVAHNTIENAGSTNETIKLHGPTLASSSQYVWCTQYGHSWCNWQYSENVEIADNYLNEGSASNTDGTVIGPQDNTSDERIRYVVIENNWFVGGSTPTQQLVLFGTGHDVVRNNVFDSSAGQNNGSFVVSTRGIEPTITDVDVYNNTFYTSQAQSGWQPLKVTTVTAPIVAQNNLAYGPSTSASSFVSGTGLASVTHDHNTGDVGTITTSPAFTSTSPFNITNAKPAAGSYAINAGTSVPVWNDALGVSWGGAYDLGAVKH